MTSLLDYTTLDYTTLDHSTLDRTTHEHAIAAPRTSADDEVVALLKAHIPLTLLMDLATCDPHSHELYEEETESLDWL